MKFTRVSSTAAFSVKSFVVAFVLITALPETAFAQVNPALLGTWKLNLAQSTFTPGPPQTSEIRTYEPAGDNRMKITEEIVGADGFRRTLVNTAKWDEKTTRSPAHRTSTPLAIRAIDAYAYEAMRKKGGQVVQTTRGVLSKDG